MKSIIDSALAQMLEVNKPQRKFISNLMETLALFCGKATFRNMSRYSSYCEHTFSRWFGKSFDFVRFNSLCLDSEGISDQAGLMLAMDASFCEKSRTKTWGIAKFFNGKSQRPEKGLEISTLALIDTRYQTAYHLSTRQTPAKMAKNSTRIDWYAGHLKRDLKAVPSNVRHLLVDGYYSKKKFIDDVRSNNLHQIGRLRHDARLRWFYNGEQKAKGRPKTYDGVVNLNTLNRFKMTIVDDSTCLYSAIVNSPHFKRTLHVVFIVWTSNAATRIALLFSTDTELAGEEIYDAYRSRFQIEFLFRDARQFTGLRDCQSRQKERLDFHFNASMTALNLLKLEDRRGHPKRNDHVISIQSWKARKLNEYWLERIISMLGLEPSCIKSKPEYQELRDFGAVAA